MKASTRSHRALQFAVFAVSAALLSACSSSGDKPMVAKKLRSKEYFAESEYGVKASPRVTNLRSNLPRGGGRDQIGKPYQVRGKWYYPKEDKSYKKTGAASWYGDAFHGRLTANGEIYDMTNLTAAHPTMPLPSYARVTNTENGSSVIVRVNDRGPYAHGRIIDLSRKAAEMLDYTHSGIAKVKVEYVGRAPLDGRDDKFLMASYRPGDAEPNATDGLPTGVMIAMNGPQPNGDIPAPAFPGVLNDNPGSGTNVASASQSLGDFVLPDVAPIAPPRPGAGFGEPGESMSLATMGYAAETDLSRLAPFAALSGSPEASSAWKGSVNRNEYVLVGTFADRSDADVIAAKLSDLGRIELQTAPGEGGKLWQTVNLHPNGTRAIDDMLRAAWDAGATDAMTVHD